jgi:hypothetical protein
VSHPKEGRRRARTWPGPIGGVVTRGLGCVAGVVNKDLAL